MPSSVFCDIFVGKGLSKVGPKKSPVIFGVGEMSSLRLIVGVEINAVKHYNGNLLGL